MNERLINEIKKKYIAETKYAIHECIICVYFMFILMKNKRRARG